MNLSENIRAYRENMKLTQKDLSYLVNVSPKMISFYERGERTPPLDMIIKLARLFNLSIDELVGYTSSNIKNIVNEDEILLLHTYRKLSSPAKADCLKYAEFSLAKEQASQKRKIT